MARRLRIEFPGALYHVLSRGDRRELIFKDDEDRTRFIETLGEACAKTGWKVHAFVLMPNHFHLVLETPGANLAAGMKWLLGTYTGRFNRRHGEVGHLFSGRYKSLLVGGKGGYLRTVVDYVHLNPVRAKLVVDGAAAQSFRWSSLPLYLNEPKKRPAWLSVEAMLGECGIPKDSSAGRSEFERRLEARRAHESDAEFHSVRQGWFLGDEQFRQELLERAEKGMGANHYGPEVQEFEVGKAERILREEAKRLGWSEESLGSSRKGEPGKVRVAQRLREETTMTLQWIAMRLHMGTKGHLSHLLYWNRRGIKPGASARARPSKGRLMVKNDPAEQKSVFPSTESSRKQAGSAFSAIKLKPSTDPNAFATGAFDTSFD